MYTWRRGAQLPCERSLLQAILYGSRPHSMVKKRRSGSWKADESKIGLSDLPDELRNYVYQRFSSQYTGTNTIRATLRVCRAVYREAQDAVNEFTAPVFFFSLATFPPNTPKMFGRLCRLPQTSIDHAPEIIMRVLDWEKATLWSVARFVSTFSAISELDKQQTSPTRYQTPVRRVRDLITFTHDFYHEDLKGRIVGDGPRERIMNCLNGLKVLGEKCKADGIYDGEGSDIRATKTAAFATSRFRPIYITNT